MEKRNLPKGRTGPKGRPRWLSALLALIFGSAIALLLAEGILQTASFVLRQRSLRDASGPAALDSADPGVAVLAVGDSHAYGLPLDEEESFPAQLEARLRERHAGSGGVGESHLQVANLGIPGVNSAFVANRLERQILQLHPRLVIVWVGINNYWNVVEVESAAGRESHFVGDLLRSSRLYRLAALAWFNTHGVHYDPEQRGGWFEGEAPPSAGSGRRVPRDRRPPGLARDLSRMAEIARSLDTAILFVTYPLPHQKVLREEILRAGGRLSVPVIDSSLSRLRARRAGDTDEDLIDTRQGAHPSGRLYGYVVEDMLPIVEVFLDLTSPREAREPVQSARSAQ